MKGVLRILAVAASTAAFQPAPTARAATVARPASMAFAPRAAPRAMFDIFKPKEPEPPEAPEEAKPKISLDGLMQALERWSACTWPRTSHSRATHVAPYITRGPRLATHHTAVRAPRRMPVAN